MGVGDAVVKMWSDENVEEGEGKQKMRVNFFFFRTEDGIRDGLSCLEFRRVLFRSNPSC